LARFGPKPRFPAKNSDIRKISGKNRSGAPFAIEYFVAVTVMATKIMERGWFPKVVPPAGGLRAVRILGSLKAGLCDDDNQTAALKYPSQA
jgi:hypothetical protein